MSKTLNLVKKYANKRKNHRVKFYDGPGGLKCQGKGELKFLKEVEKEIINYKQDSSMTDKLGIDFLSFDGAAKDKKDPINYYHYNKYSFTQLEAYKNCPLQYKFQYHDSYHYIMYVLIYLY